MRTGGQSGHGGTLGLRRHPTRIVTVGQKTATQAKSGQVGSKLGVSLHLNDS